MLKRLFSIITISLVLTGSFFSVYNIKYPVYADDTSDGWTQVTTNEQLVQAFKYYCKSRDVTIEGSIADAVTSFTTQSFNGIVNFLGIDVNALQANLKYQTDGNLGYRFLFNTFSIDAYNRIFSQFLQDNDLDVGDENVDKTVAQGLWFTDADGVGCYAFVSNYVTSVNSSPTSTNPSNVYSQKGTYYRYSQDYCKSILDGGQNVDSNTIHLTNSVSFQFKFVVGGLNSTAPYMDIKTTLNNKSATAVINANYNHTYDRNGYPCIIVGQNAVVYLGVYWIENTNEMRLTPLYQITNGQTENGSVTINSTVINNNTYEGDTIINNNGDVINNNYPDPNPDPTPDPPTIPDDDGWQDFTLPEMPNDWLIYGMEKKFPFDIPFNIMFALSLLNHEPEIPKFEGDIDLQVCTWHYDIDLTPFDDIATILRRFEVLAFIIGLAILTKELINWG